MRLEVLTLLCISGCARVWGEGEEAALKTAYESLWEWRLRDNPEFASNIGDNRYDDMLEDYRFIYIDERKIQLEEIKASVDRIDPSVFNTTSLIVYKVMQNMIQTWLDGYEWRDYGPMNPISFLDGIQTKYTSRADVIKFRTENDFRNFITRIHGYGKRVDEVILRMKRAVLLGTTHHAISMAKVPGQLDEILAMRNNQSNFAFYKPFLTKLDDVVTNTTKRAEIRQRAMEAIDYFIGKIGELKTFIIDEYMPNTRTRPGVMVLNKGKEYYKACLKWHLSKDIAPEKIHSDGKKEVEKVYKKMEKIVRDQGHEGTMKEYFDHLRTRSDFIINDGDEIIERMRKILEERIRPALSKYFEEMPYFPMEIKKMPYDGPNGIYKNGAADLSRNGIFYANVFKPEYNPTYGMTALLLHETDPGHHLQDAYALTSDVIPAFMKSTDFSKYFAAPMHFPFYTAYSEGWSLYCEELGEELKIYQGDFEKLGKYNYEIFRAARMVVDTGLHYYKWTKEEAVKYMLKYTTSSRGSIEREIDRYATWPGQATSYTVGKLEIVRMRKVAEATLGKCFDIKQFHKILLSYGAVPLDVLEIAVHRWMNDVGYAARKNGVKCRDDGPSHSATIGPSLVTTALLLAFLAVKSVVFSSAGL